MDARRRLNGPSESPAAGPLCAATEDAAYVVSSLSFSCDDDLLGLASADPSQNKTIQPAIT